MRNTLPLRALFVQSAVKPLLVVIVTMGCVFWVGYSSRKSATTARARAGSSGARSFEPTAARLERGRYIVEGPAHCFECHSEVDWEHPGGQPKDGKKGGGKNFADYGLPWLTAPNITPDVETGAGTWTNEQLARAIREGIGHDGRRLFPVMPYEFFRKMSDEDLASVIVYVPYGTRRGATVEVNHALGLLSQHDGRRSESDFRVPANAPAGAASRRQHGTSDQLPGVPRQTWLWRDEPLTAVT